MDYHVEMWFSAKTGFLKTHQVQLLDKFGVMEVEGWQIHHGHLVIDGYVAYTSILLKEQSALMRHTRSQTWYLITGRQGVQPTH